MTNESKKEAIAKAPERRVRRTPIGQRNILTVSGKEPGFHYRFVNDTGDRIQSEFLDNGWEVVQAKDVSIGDKRLGKPGTSGTAAEAAVGKGEKAVLLRIKQEWYDEDQDAKQAYVNKTEEAMHEKALDGTYGKLDITRST
jgi:hypothetical protein